MVLAPFFLIAVLVFYYRVFLSGFKKADLINLSSTAIYLQTRLAPDYFLNLSIIQEYNFFMFMALHGLTAQAANSGL